MRRSDCPIGCALDVIGDKWSLLILRDALYKGLTSYNQFLNSPEKISTNILANRLKKLTEFGIFEKKADPTNKLKFNYHLTQKGKDLGPIMMEVGKWGLSYFENTVDMISKVKEAPNS